MRGEKGFTFVELLVVMGIVALLAGAASVTTVQVITVTKQGSDHMTAVRQAQNAGYWISRDALMAENVVVDDDPETADFLILNWTEWGYDEDSVYHVVTYSFQDLSEDHGKLKRTYWNSTGAGKETVIAEHIYYNPDDPENTTEADYTTPVLTVRIAASLGEASETREYTVWCRPEF